MNCVLYSCVVCLIFMLCSHSYRAEWYPVEYMSTVGGKIATYQGQGRFGTQAMVVGYVDEYEEKDDIASSTTIQAVNDISLLSHFTSLGLPQAMATSSKDKRYGQMIGGDVDVHRCCVRCYGIISILTFFLGSPKQFIHQSMCYPF